MSKHPIVMMDYGEHVWLRSDSLFSALDFLKEEYEDPFVDDLIDDMKMRFEYSLIHRQMYEDIDPDITHDEASDRINEKD